MILGEYAPYNSILTLIFTVLIIVISLLQGALENANKTNFKSNKDDIESETTLKFIENAGKQKILSNIFIGTLMAYNLFSFIFPKMTSFILSHENLNEHLILAIASLGLAIAYYIFTIFLPNEIGRQNSDKLAHFSGRALYFTTILIRPLGYILLLISNLILKLLRQEKYSFKEEFSEEEVISMLEIGQDSGAIKEEGKKMINSIFAFDDKLAYEIMTPRTDVFSIDILDEPEEYIDELMEMRYSRIPVYEDDSDNIIGILNIKDYLIKAREKGFEKIDIKEILRPALFVPDTKNIDSLFVEFQKQKQHIAILIDEYGGFSGILTMEDIIEEVMGDIDDEYDEDEMEIQHISKNTYILHGNMYIDDINESLNLNLESETSETLGGFIIDILGEIPDEKADDNIKVSYENFKFEILSVKDRRIEKVKMIIEELKDVDNLEKGSE